MAQHEQGQHRPKKREKKKCVRESHTHGKTDEEKEDFIWKKKNTHRAIELEGTRIRVRKRVGDRNRKRSYRFRTYGTLRMCGRWNEKERTGEREKKTKQIINRSSEITARAKKWLSYFSEVINQKRKHLVEKSISLSCSPFCFSKICVCTQLID